MNVISDALNVAPVILKNVQKQIVMLLFISVVKIRYAAKILHYLCIVFALLGKTKERLRSNPSILIPFVDAMEMSTQVGSAFRVKITTSFWS